MIIKELITFLACISYQENNYLAINLMKMSRVFDKEYKIAPPTWLLPTDWSSFIDQFNNKRAKTFI